MAEGIIINKKWEKVFFVNKKTSYIKIRQLIKKLNIQINYKIINVFGTNGKGSVANYLSQGLMENNFKVGVFTSPHLIYPNERIKINDKNISDKDFFSIIKLFPDLNFFETLYVAALIYFEKNKVDIAIIEAGIGGNKDTSKACQGEVGVLTSIGIDHQEILGKSKLKIAKDKAGIISNTMKVYIPTVLEKNLKKIFTKKSSKYEIINNEGNDYNDENRKMAEGVLFKEFGIIKKTFKKPKGRTDFISKRKMILDVAHNQDGILASLNYLHNNKIEVKNVVICIKKTKNIKEVFKLFKNYNIYYFKLNKNFKNFEGIKEIDYESLFKFKDNTLYIGSFQFIGMIYEKNKI